MSRYTILGEGKAIHCSKCGRISHNPNDVQNRYCAHCNEFHTEVLWGVIHLRDGLLAADDDPLECQRVAERWQRITGEVYVARALTEEEAAMALRWAPQEKEEIGP